MAELDRRRARAIFLLVCFTLAAIALLFVMLNLLVPTPHLSSWIIFVISAVATGALGAVSGYTIQVANRISIGKLRVAITGGPGAGKTVLAVLLFDRLMSPNDRGISFTAESASLISVYQTMRGIDEQKWPASTFGGVVNRYQGKIRFGRARKSDVVELELGDSAGENWIDLDTKTDGNLLSQSSYLEYVVSANALVHVLGADELFKGGLEGLLQRDLQDLQFVGQLMQTGGKPPKQVDLLIVLTKTDLVYSKVVQNDEVPDSVITNAEYDPLLSLIYGASSRSEIFTAAEMEAALSQIGSRGLSGTSMGREIRRQVSSVVNLASQLSATYRSVGVMFSSIDFRSAGPWGARPLDHDDLLVWIQASTFATRSRGLMSLFPKSARWD
jgi:hypothetical protein